MYTDMNDVITNRYRLKSKFKSPFNKMRCKLPFPLCYHIFQFFVEEMSFLIFWDCVKARPLCYIVNQEI